jgi:hypothetical protein
MRKPAPRVARAQAKVAPRTKAKSKILPGPPPSFVPFSYQDVSYFIDLDKSKVYKKFIEIEKSKQFSIINAYRATNRLSIGQ